MWWTIVSRFFCTLIFHPYSFTSLPGGSYVTADSAASVSGVVSGGSADCPRACFCNTLSKIVYCSRRGLAWIPGGIPTDSVQLNLNGNQFQSTTLQRSNFSVYARLEHLYMSECGIEHLETDTFLDLVSLQWLDLSNNRLKVLKENTFRGVHLQHLFLNGNRNIQLLPGSFTGLVTTGLYLHDCSLSELHPDVLTPLNDTVRYLWLNGNELDRLEPSLSVFFSSLLHVRLGSNPLQCDCDALWLKKIFDNKSDIFKGAPPPSCLTPQRLKGRFFNESSVYDFRCRAPMFTQVEAIFNATVARLRCSAIGDPAPTLYWIQPSGRATKYDRPNDVEARENDGVLEIDSSGAGERDVRRRYGMFICIAANNAGNVSLTINVAYPSDGATKTTLPDVRQQTRTPGYWKYHPQTNGKGDPPPTRSYNISEGKTSQQYVYPFGGTFSSVLRLPDISTGLGRFRSPGTTVGGGGPPSTTSGEEPETGTRTGNWMERTFTLTELVGAIVGTHFGTMAAYAIVAVVCYVRRCRRRQRRVRRVHHRRTALNDQDREHHLHQNLKASSQHLSPCDSSPPPEAMFLNGEGHRHVNPDGDYTPPTARSRLYSPMSTPYTQVRR